MGGCAEPGDALRYLFDLTTSAQWTGAAVGIVRVEQELARRARRCLGDAVRFCLYDRSQNRFLLIEEDVASEILEGRLQIDFGALSPRFSALNTVRGKIRRAMRTNVTLYQAFQRLRGRRFTRDEIRRIQREEFGGEAKRIVPLSSIPSVSAQLDADVCIISGGLDWQYKDLRKIWELKQVHRFRYCSIVYDLIPLSFPHFVPTGYDAFLADYFGELLWVADCALCISEAVRAEWTSFCDSFGVDALPSHVFSLGCDLPSNATEALPDSLDDKRFALFVSTIEPRKNHRVLYEAWDRGIRSGRLDPTRDRLVFVGRRGWAVDDLMREIAANPLTRDTIVILNRVSDELLAELYRRCAFVLFPSFYEGFGLPVAEALGYGKPCITSDGGSLAEIGGELVRRIDPKDTLRWADTIAHYMNSPHELEEWSRRIKAAHRPVTWDDAALRFFGLIKETVS